MALKVVVLVGGVGGAKLAYGLAQVLPAEDLSIIVNTGDDFWLYGLRICPDLDTITYTLSGMVDKNNGWGLGGDTRNMLETLKRYGEEPWFGLGDKDIATHLLRTAALREGESLTNVTGRLTKKLGIPQRILPMTDAPVATIVDTDEYGEIDFQTYFVRYRWQPTVKSLRLDGIDAATVSQPVRDAVQKADIILIGPSNPWLSIDPILAVPGMRALITNRSIPRVAVSPIVGGKALKGPADKLMGELGYEPSAETVVDYYGEVINGFVYDQTDTGLVIPLPHTMTCETVMKTDEDKIILAQNVIDWIKKWI
ncbi:MAG: 2-phospho-L-lactate transferase [Chloroflexota bacterium]